MCNNNNIINDKMEDLINLIIKREADINQEINIYIIYQLSEKKTIGIIAKGISNKWIQLCLNLIKLKETNQYKFSLIFNT